MGTPGKGRNRSNYRAANMTITDFRDNQDFGQNGNNDFIM